MTRMAAHEATTSARPAVELIGIDKRFGPVHANKNVDLAIPAGTIHGIVGENGAGKSTLLNAISGLERLDEQCLKRRDEGGQRHSKLNWL